MPLNLWNGRLRLQKRHGLLVLPLLLYLGLASYQLGLPGLHYDEAREAGVNAMEILTGAPTTAFRGTGPILFGRQWPLMVQDYIGALNVYLSLPFLWSTGIGVPNLRFLPIFLGFVTLLLVERTVSEYIVLTNINSNKARQPPAQTTPINQTVPISMAGLTAMLLLAASPTFVFWSRQGIFVTNLTEPLAFGCIWLGLRWLRCGRPRQLGWSAFLGGAALYAKLLAVWVIAPFVLLAGGWWLGQRRGHVDAVPSIPPVRPWQWITVPVAFLLPLAPLFWFNLQNGGTANAIGTNLNTSYYGVDNLAIGANFVTRFTQIGHVITGDHLWYLGSVYGNPLAIWVGSIVVLIVLVQRPRWLLPPLLLVVAIFVASLFSISDLFITHYALVQPFLLSLIALAIYGCCFADSRERGRARQRRRLGMIIVVLWVLLDLTVTARYHGALTRSGGLADHSDASYHLAYYLRYNGLGAPIALDWGFDAPVRYLSEGAVAPIEIFGYDAVSVPADDFSANVERFLNNPGNVYLLHAPHATVFAGRREVFLQKVAEAGLIAQLETTFAQRDGTPLYEVWRAVP